MDVAKDMWKVYAKTSTEDLIKNKHRKLNELWRLQDINTYWAKKDKARLRDLIVQIDAIIKARAAQDTQF